MAGLIVRIDLGPHGRLGPGKLKLLEQIATHGSISGAGRAMNMSYRQAWSLVDQLNSAFKEPVVQSQTGGKSGGGAVLTDFGRLLLIHCSAIVANANKMSGPHLEFITAVLKPASEARVESKDTADDDTIDALATSPVEAPPSTKRAASKSKARG
jgi:molybdate transport system regulatory protein